ncbi:flavin-containing monooxygenase [Rhizorhapis sp. SPR117]|uniref:flavin-containing monooxygenase n=1 Tax=Rhizorhapis sp. SPR117 TaxID=2912611 RepID=UPI001F1F087C|nr:NAD(P)/FAD-dependent oxidoreductase [Rhizorhapis sp. SPR117]
MAGNGIVDGQDGSLDFSPEALEEKYRIEREKRVRTDGLQQYVDLAKITGDHAVDPYLEEELVREPFDEDANVLIIGGGFSGMMTAVALGQAGIEDVRIIEKGSDFGGAWYWNRYPGVACDVESYVYLPLLEQTGYIPTQKYVGGAEIFAYYQQVARQFGLYDSAIFQTGVEAITWIEDKDRWLVETDRGDRLYGRFVVLAGGLLHKPKIPNLPGIESFKGNAFHTARWDYEYTGGDSYGNLSKLSDKRVGIVGTGATAVQVVPQVGASAKHLYVFQRTLLIVAEK